MFRCMHARECLTSNTWFLRQLSERFKLRFTSVLQHLHACIGGLIIWYFRKIAEEVWHIGFLICDIAKEQGWIEVEEE